MKHSNTTIIIKFAVRVVIFLVVISTILNVSVFRRHKECFQNTVIAKYELTNVSITNPLVNSSTLTTTSTMMTTTSQPLYRTSPNIFLFSACFRRELRIVGIMECSNRVNFSAQFILKNGSSSTSFLLQKQGIDSWCPSMACYFSGFYFSNEHIPYAEIDSSKPIQVISGLIQSVTAQWFPNLDGISHRKI